MSGVVELIGKLLLDETWRLVGIKDGIEIWRNAGHDWINHIVRATGEVIEK